MTYCKAACITPHIRDIVDITYGQSVMTRKKWLVLSLLPGLYGEFCSLLNIIDRSESERKKRSAGKCTKTPDETFFCH